MPTPLNRIPRKRKKYNKKYGWSWMFTSNGTIIEYRTIGYINGISTPELVLQFLI